MKKGLDWIETEAAKEDAERRRETTSDTGTKVLFLGVGGVLHPRHLPTNPPRTPEWRAELLALSEQVAFDPAALKALGDLVSRSQCKIVPCTQWQWVFREGAALVDWLEAKGLPRAWLHQNPVLPRRPTSEVAHGVGFWLEEHGPVDWVAVVGWPLYRSGWQAERQVLVEGTLGQEELSAALGAWRL